MAVLIYKKMAERDGARFLAQAQAALFCAPPAARLSRRKRAISLGAPGQASSLTGMLKYRSALCVQQGANLYVLSIVRSPMVCGS